MASISSDPNGRRRILFVASDGSRKTMRLGKVSLRTAATVKVHIEALATASLTGETPADATTRWAMELNSKMHDKLAGVGLVKRRESARLGAFLEAYVTGRPDIKPATVTVLGHTKRCLIEHFGADKPLREITPGDADGFRSFLIQQNLADNTVRRRIGIARQYFKAAMRRGRTDPAGPADQHPWRAFHRPTCADLRLSRQPKLRFSRVYTVFVWVKAKIHKAI